jgi:hypothetical protein
VILERAFQGNYLKIGGAFRLGVAGQLGKRFGIRLDKAESKANVPTDRFREVPLSLRQRVDRDAERSICVPRLRGLPWPGETIDVVNALPLRADLVAEPVEVVSKQLMLNVGLLSTAIRLWYGYRSSSNARHLFEAR